MKIEILIYAYLAVCVSMILFNIVCIFVFQKKDTYIRRQSILFFNAISAQLDKEAVDEEHKQLLEKKLTQINCLMAYDRALEELYPQEPDAVQDYIKQLSPVFVYLAAEYNKRDKMQASYFPYIIKKFLVFQGVGVDSVIDPLIDYVSDPNLYSRENALQALYSIGDADCVLEALKILDRQPYFHHEKMIADGLLTFSGDKSVLDEKLWQAFDQFSLKLQKPILDYFRFSSGEHGEKMLSIMSNSEYHQELRFSAIRYFAKYHYEPALPCLYSLAVQDSPYWEYKAITATALGNYPSDKTEAVLKQLLCNDNWYIRYNAADSLDQLDLRYDELIDIFEGKDRYASDMIRYRFDRKNLYEEETITL